jgi:hypothetical protein
LRTFAPFCSNRIVAHAEARLTLDLVAGSISSRLYCKPCCRVLKYIGNKALDHSRVGRRFFNGQSIHATMVNAAVPSFGKAKRTTRKVVGRRRVNR